MRVKQDVVTFVKRMKKLIVAFGVVAFLAEMVLLIFAFMGDLWCIIGAVALGVAFLVTYGFYAMRVSMGAVLGIEVTDKVVHVKTKRKTWTYDVKRGCVRVRERRRYYVATFETQDSRDSFLFYKRVWFSQHGAEQFTEEEIRSFYPAFGAENQDR